MAAIWIDGTRFEVDASRNVLEVALELGFDLPYFCWHPALGSVGACRQCAVKKLPEDGDGGDGGGKIVMACLTAAADGTRVSIADPEARHFRAAVIEWLMLNHPHDCPVCDEGGECHLQDMTVMTGHTYRRTRFPKRTFRNQYLGPFVNHEMNRCIECYRCVRFYDEYAGGRDLQALGAHDWVYFGRQRDGVLESEFAGNLVEVCPTGVFTDRSLKSHYTRKWDLETAPSVCVHCGLGCNTTPGERYGELRRIRNRYHGDVNGYFLCDRGRYGYEFVNGERRLRRPLAPRGSGEQAEEMPRQAVLDRLAPLFADPGRMIGIGSPRASLESLYALRTLVGAEHFFQGASPLDARLTAIVLELLRGGPARSASLRELERCDAALVLGEDLPNTAPVAALMLRQSVRQQPLARARALGIPDWHDHAVRNAVQDRTGPLFVATPAATRIDDVATEALRASPEDLARLGHAVAHRLDPEAPGVVGIDDATRHLAAEIAAALRDAERPVVVSGTGCGSEAVIRAAAAVAAASARARADATPAALFYAVPESNSMGAAMLGGGDLDAAVAAAEDERIDTAVIVENDLFRRLDGQALERLWNAVDHLIVLDCVAHDTAARAEVLLPAATFAESHGTRVNNEGRAQRSYQVFPAGDDVAPSWRWIRDGMRAARRDGAGWEEIDDVARALAGEIAAFADLPGAWAPPDLRVAGSPVPRELHRYSGRTAMRADRDVNEPRPPPDPGSPLVFSMEGTPAGRAPPRLVADYWSPGWNSVQALNRFQEEIAGPLRGGDPGVRLIEPPAGAAPPYPRPVAAPRSPGAGALRAVPMHQVFGSDELSALSGPVAELCPAPYVALSPEDAARIGLRHGEPARVRLGDEAARTLVVRLDAGVPSGVAGLYPAAPPLPEAAWVEVEPP